MAVTGQYLIFLCNFRESVYPIKITRGMSYSDAMTTLISRLNKVHGFNEALSVDALSLTFYVGTAENVSIDNDDDLECAFSLATQFGVGTVNVSVHLNSMRIEGVYVDETEHLTDDEALPHDMSSDDEAEPDYLENYLKHGEKLLRSDAWKQAIKGVGQVFENGRRHFKLEVGKCAIATGFEYIYKKNDLDRVTCVCKFKNNGCKWHIHARLDKVHQYFSIRKLDKIHTCNLVFRKLKDYRMGSNIIADEIKGYFDRKGVVSPRDIKAEFKDAYGIDISYASAWRGVEVAKEAYYGQTASTYNQLVGLIKCTMATNPLSVTHLDFDVPTSRFKRFFISYGACIEGFKYCRPLLFLDGTFLKSRYKGQLLAATGKDANKGLYPLAIGVVDSENIENWTWFMDNLRTVLKDDDRVITFVSDRNKGLMEGVHKVFPNSPHSFCLLHLRANLKDRLGGLSREVRKRITHLLQKAAQTPSQQECITYIEEMVQAGKEAVRSFLIHAPLEHWANSYFKGKRYGELYSNVAESFNAWIRTERSLPVKCMIDDIRKKMMTRMAARRKLALKSTDPLCPAYLLWFERAKHKGLTWEINESDHDVYEVMSNPSVSVNIEERTCTCGKWQIRCFPCSHSIAAILHTGKDAMDYIEDYYTVANWYSAHAKSIVPTPTLMQQLVQVQDIAIMPPLTKVQPGRPKNSRYTSRSEKFALKRPMTCSRCGIKGTHTKRTCKAIIN